MPRLETGRAPGVPAVAHSPGASSSARTVPATRPCSTPLCRATCLPLQDRGRWDEDNAKLFPKTVQFLRELNGEWWWERMPRADQGGLPPLCVRARPPQTRFAPAEHGPCFTFPP